MVFFPPCAMKKERETTWKIKTREMIVNRGTCQRPNKVLTELHDKNTVILQVFGVVLFSVISVVNDFTEIKNTPKWKKNTLSDHDSIHGHRKLNETERSAIARYRNFNVPKICKITVMAITKVKLKIEQSEKSTSLNFSINNPRKATWVKYHSSRLWSVEWGAVLFDRYRTDR